MLSKQNVCKSLVLSLALMCTAATVNAGNGNNGCKGLPDYNALKAVLVAATAAETNGLINQTWATIVDRDGVVCAVAFSGINRGAQWPGSRLISAQKRLRLGHLS
jgi:L-cystine uptake protein TcyP (sodium:dicarboxylate symporter family)